MSAGVFRVGDFGEGDLMKKVHLCRGIVGIDLQDTGKMKIGQPRRLTEKDVVRCGKPATKYQEQLTGDDGWCCDDCYMTPEEWEEA